MFLLPSGWIDEKQTHKQQVVSSIDSSWKEEMGLRNDFNTGENSRLLDTDTSSNENDASQTFYRKNNSNPATNPIASDSATKQIIKRYLPAAARVAPMWWVSNYFYNYALSYTTITSSTIISNMGCVFTFLFAWAAGQERYHNIKLLGVVLAFLGSVLTSVHDGGSESEPTSPLDSTDTLQNTNTNDKLWGDFAGLMSALGHAGYTVMVRKVNANDDGLSMPLLLAFIGLLHMVFLGPLALYKVIYSNLFQTTIVGLQQVPSIIHPVERWQIFSCLIVKGLFGNLLPDYFWGRAIVLTSATVATVGLNVTIPLAFLSDALIMQRAVFTTTTVIGAIMVIVGFLFVNI